MRGGGSNDQDVHGRDEKMILCDVMSSISPSHRCVAASSGLLPRLKGVNGRAV